MTKRFTLELVTPEKLLVAEEVEMVVVPGSEGDFGVLAEHAPMIASLRIGLLSTKGRNGGDEEIFVAGGFAEVAGDRCTILAEEALARTSLDCTKAKKRWEDAEFDLKHAKTEAERAAAERRIAVAVAQIEYAA
jgi:F-type H+-transporting ATPase subunit epsilon